MGHQPVAVHDHLDGIDGEACLIPGLQGETVQAGEKDRGPGEGQPGINRRRSGEETARPPERGAAGRAGGPFVMRPGESGPSVRACRQRIAGDAHRLQQGIPRERIGTRQRAEGSSPSADFACRTIHAGLSRPRSQSRAAIGKAEAQDQTRRRTISCACTISGPRRHRKKSAGRDGHFVCRAGINPG